MMPNNVAGQAASMSARFVFRNLAEVRRDLDNWDERRKKAAVTAGKVEMFRLRKKMQTEIRKGGIAGTPFAPLRVVTRGKRYSRKPLSKLAFFVRYSTKQVGDTTHLSVGFDGPQSTKKWRMVAHKVQEGGDIDPDYSVAGSTLRKLWRRVGAGHKRTEDAQSRDDAERFSKFYFLRKGTTKLKNPARPIVEPFWSANKTEAERNILDNFERKMRGERI